MSVKLLTVYSDSHKAFLEAFLKTFPQNDGIELVQQEIPQECPSAFFNSPGWAKTSRTKLSRVLDQMESMNEGEIFIYSDVDVIFLKPLLPFITDELNGVDIKFQNDRGTVCMGFFAAKVNFSTKQLLKNVLDLAESENLTDQEAANKVVQYGEGEGSVFFSPKVYSLGFRQDHLIPFFVPEFFAVPEGTVVFHANYLMGNPVKLNAINCVLKQSEL
jgi:hypothetical protein